MKTKINIEVEVKPFTVPNYVILETAPRPRRDGLQAPQSLPLSALDQTTLYRMCRDFEREVFKKAGVEKPPEAK